MALIRPFRALRPVPEKAKQVSCVPYDVVYESEVRSFIEKNPLSFLRVTRSEAEFAEDATRDPADVFARARTNLDRLIADGVYRTDAEPSLFAYQLSAGGHSQTGVVGCCSLDEYKSGKIKKHENVRPDKVADRTGHLLAVRAQTGLIFLAFRNTNEIRRLINDAITAGPLYDFECSDGIRHRIWRITDTDQWIKAFDEVPALYIADGHHRAESALAAREMLRNTNGHEQASSDLVVAGMFPAEDLRILPYNRVVKDLNALEKAEFIRRLSESFIVTPTSEKTPSERGEICMYIDGEWSKLTFNVQNVHEPDPIERLDVSILQEHVLGPILGITDATTDERIGFVGGKRGTDELERIVDEGIARVAFSMYPTTMDDLLAVSDMGEVMPPKSTWFEPKLRDGLLVYEL